MNQSCFSLRFLSQNSLWKNSLSSIHFVGIKVFIAGYEMECEKSLFSKTGCIGESLATGMSREFQSLVTKLGQTLLFVLQCSDPAVLTFHLPACFTCVLHFNQSPFASQLRVPVTSHLFVAHLIKSSHSLTHNPYIIPT